MEVVIDQSGAEYVSKMQSIANVPICAAALMFARIAAPVMTNLFFKVTQLNLNSIKLHKFCIFLHFTPVFPNFQRFCRGVATYIKIFFAVNLNLSGKLSLTFFCCVVQKIRMVCIIGLEFLFPTADLNRQ